VYTIGVASQVSVSRLNVVKEFLKVFLNEKESANLVRGILGVVWMTDVSAVAAVCIAVIEELRAGSIVWVRDGHYLIVALFV
jgi:hypothetical protein